MADDAPTPADATSIWDERYKGGEHVGSQPTVVGDPIDYTQHTFLYQHAIAQPTTGRLDGWVLDELGRRYMAPAPERVLSIGCGMAFVEEHMVKCDYARHVLAYEMSGAAIEAARARVAGEPYAARLELRSGDVLDENLPTGGFDVVFVQAAIHHFMRIEEMFRLMHRVLRPGGLLIFDEYIGPDHHIYGDEVMAVVNAVNDCLAERYRWDVLKNETRSFLPQPSLEFMLQHDPSEGVHASRILPLTYQFFDVIDRRDYGGTIMRPFFTGILPNFDWDDPKDQTVARLIVLLERLLLRHGAIPSYQTAIVARRRDEPRPPLTAAAEARIGFADWGGLAPEPAAAQPEPEKRRGGLLGLLRRPR